MTPEEAVTRLVLSVILGAVTAVLAHQRGRNVVGWFLIGVIVPCVGLILVLVLPDLRAQREKEEQQRRQERRLREQIAQERAKNQAFRQHAAQRLDEHDDALELDTRTADPDRQLEEPPPPLPKIPEGLPDDVPSAGWWYVRPGATSPEGPFEVQDLREHVSQRVISARTLVWHESLDDWMPLNQSPLRNLT